MSAMTRTTKVERYIKRLEAKMEILPKDQAKLVKEIAADMRFEFNIEGSR